MGRHAGSLPLRRSPNNQSRNIGHRFDGQVAQQVSRPHYLLHISQYCFFPSRVFNYRMHPENVRILREANIDYCSLANNHTLDYSLQGLRDTLIALDAARIAHAGAGMSADEAMKPAILERKGHRIGFFRCVAIFQVSLDSLPQPTHSFSDHPKEWAAGQNRPGISYLNTDHPSDAQLSAVATAVRRAKSEAGCDLCVVSIHWGPNYRWQPP